LTLIEEFIKDNYNSLTEAAKKISNNDPLYQELLHYTIDEFLRKVNVKDIIETGGGKFYCIRIMMNSWKSVTSPFYYTYRQQTQGIDNLEYIKEEEDENVVKIADKIKRELNKLSWYDRILFETFVDENHTISSLSRATGIPRTSISLSINRIRKHIKRNI
jgi:hypothetical protein